MTKLVVELPTRETPGYLRRSKRAMEYKEKIATLGTSPALIDEMVEFLLPLVKEPTTKKEAREALWDISEAQFDEMLESLIGKKEVPPATASDLNNSTSQE